MKAVVGCAAIVFALATASAANAKGCLKGAAVGGVAGHYASHHGILGAVAGCVIGRHEANKRALMQSDQINRPYRDIRDDERRL
jgi:outer membrane lipoprotein SlyB